jgi:hypothetical protein
MEPKPGESLRQGLQFKECDHSKGRCHGECHIVNFSSICPDCQEMCTGTRKVPCVKERNDEIPSVADSVLHPKSNYQAKRKALAEIPDIAGGTDSGVQCSLSLYHVV